MNSLLKRGTRLTVNGQGAEVTLWHANSGRLDVCSDDGVSRSLTSVEFTELYKSGALKLQATFFGEGPQEPTKDDTRALQGLSENQCAIVDRRVAYVRAVTTPEGRWIGDADERLAAIESIAEKTQDSSPPSERTLFRWYTRFRVAKGDVRSLLPRHWRKGNRGSKLSEEIEAVMKKALEAYHLKGRHSVKHVYKSYLPKLLEKNGISIEERPSYKTFAERARELTAYDKCFNWHGHSRAYNEFPNGRPFPAPEFALARVEIDNTPLDINLIDSSGKIIGRPYATFLIDADTRMIVGFYISLTPVNKRSILHAVIHSVLPKNYVKEKYPSLKHDWPCYGLYGLLVSDNGMELLADSVRASLYRLGIDYQQLKRKTPRMKGRIERFFRTMNEDLLHQLPGTTHSNYRQAGDNKKAQKPCLTFEQLDEIIHTWIVDVYHVEFHRGAQDSPLGAWRKSNRMFEAPVLPASFESLAWLLMEEEDRRLQKYGLDLFGMKYNSDALMSIARRKGWGVALAVFYDPDNIATVKVKDPDGEEFVEAECVLRGYTKGFLPKDIHEAVRILANVNTDSGQT